MRLNTTIRRVAYPPANSENPGLLRCPGAKEYALNAPDHPDMAGDMGHYTTDMSGASSAFMPTTL